MLSEIVERDRILDTELWREIYARDASYFDIKPQCVVRPHTVEQIRRIIDLARTTGTSLTFRTGGTSLSGQTLGNGIICELRTNWRRAEVRDNGRKIWFEPGLTANDVNHLLAPHHHKIGPDPASSAAAMMGGILSNNSSGMEAGVAHNSYHTLSSIEFILPNGHRYNTALSADRKRFRNQERELCDGLLKIRSEILADDRIHEKIIHKYRIKNVTGYSMNSFLDYDDPIDIFAHLLIGSEGTLAYIVSAELDTIPLLSTYSSTLLYFDSVTTAAAQAKYLGDTGALAVEMMDYASLRSSRGLSSDMPHGTTALLVDYGADSSEALEDKIRGLSEKFRVLPHLVRVDDFTHTVREREELWNVRNGVFPCVAGARVPGSAVILEDVVAPVADLDKLVDGVQTLFDRHGYEGAIFGHARDGNIHPLITPGMAAAKDTDNFKRFIEGFVNHVLNLGGSLKGEHGTGRAMAPFVEREWGPEIYDMMKRIKKLADPQGFLNPGVMINDDPEAFIKPIKSLDLFGRDLGYDRADRCMECGYCEHVCPSRAITLTPRQRLQALRVIKRTGDPGLRKEYSYIGRDTCCSDGSCLMPCPMSINTGVVTDAVRKDTNPALLRGGLTMGARHYGAVESSVKGVLKAAVAAEKVISPYPLIWASDLMHRIYRQFPHFSRHFPMPAAVHYRTLDNPEWIYFPACVTRIFGASSLGKDDLITVMFRIADRAGLRLSLPKELHGLCCSQIWEHKGDPEGQKITANRTVEEFYRLSDHGRIPILCDTTSCTHTLLSLKNAEVLTPENAVRYARLRIVDICVWLKDEVLPRLKVVKPKKHILLHPTCASRLAGLQDAMVEIAEKCADSYELPYNCYCCGAAGDRGFIFPEVAKSATRDELQEVKGKEFDGYYSLARTCEISMMDTMGLPYESIVHLVDETT